MFSLNKISLRQNVGNGRVFVLPGDGISIISTLNLWPWRGGWDAGVRSGGKEERN